MPQISLSPKFHGAQESLLLECRLEGHLRLLEVQHPDTEGEAGHVHREPAERTLLSHETCDEMSDSDRKLLRRFRRGTLTHP